MHVLYARRGAAHAAMKARVHTVTGFFACQLVLSARPDDYNDDNTINCLYTATIHLRRGSRISVVYMYVYYMRPCDFLHAINRAQGGASMPYQGIFAYKEDDSMCSRVRNAYYRADDVYLLRASIYSNTHIWKQVYKSNRIIFAHTGTHRMYVHCAIYK